MRKMTEEHKAKISKAMKGVNVGRKHPNRVLSMEHKANISKSMKNNTKVIEGRKHKNEPQGRLASGDSWGFVSGTKTIVADRKRVGGYNDIEGLLRAYKNREKAGKRSWVKLKEEVKNECS